MGRGCNFFAEFDCCICIWIYTHLHLCKTKNMLFYLLFQWAQPCMQIL